MKLFFKIVLFFATHAYGWNIETLPELRTQQYDSGLIEKIIVFSAPRNGSSVVFNVFKYFFEQKDSLLLPHHEDNPSRKVLKTHNCKYFDLYAKKTALFIVPIRNPLEAAISHARVGALGFLPDRKRAEGLINKQFTRLKHAKKKQLEGLQVIFLPYEQFENNLPFLLEEIERLFSIKIDETDRRIVLLGYSKENVALATQSLENFRQFLPISGFHGSHIHSKSSLLSPNLLFWLEYYFAKNNEP